MKKYFGYVRVSSKKQGEGVSLEAQKDAIEQFAARNGFDVVRWFEEQVTAAKRGRPEFNKMMKMLRRGEADGLIVHKIDRSSRNFFDWARLGTAIDSGVQVWAATGSADFNTTSGRLQADIEFVFGAHYIRNLKDEVYKGQRGQLKNGYYPFKAPIGYLNNGKQALKTLDRERAAYIQLAFELYATGEYSTRSLREEITRRGLRNEGGQPISKGCLEKFLANPFYTGIIRIQCTGEIYEGKHEALITPALFKTVQEVRAGKSGKKATQHNHLYRGLFRCQECSNAMIPERQKSYVYYRCHTPVCRGNCVREEALASATNTIIERAAFSRQDIRHIIQKFKSWTAQTKRNEGLKSSDCSLKEIEERLEQLDDAAIERIIDKATHARRKEALLLEKAALQEKQQQIIDAKRSAVMLRQFLERIKALAEHYISSGPYEKREIVKLATSNRRVLAKSVNLEPSDWLVAAEKMLGVSYCAQSRTTSRRQQKMHKAQLDHLLDGMKNFEAASTAELQPRDHKMEKLHRMQDG